MWKFLTLAPLFTALFPSGSAQAEDRVNVSKGATLAGPGLAAHGYDVVAFFTDGKPALGSDTYAIAHDGGTYRFASQEYLNAFKANPDKFLPAYGGFCSYGVALGKKFDGDPHYWRIVDGKLYLNLNADIQAEWSKDVPAHIRKADKNWNRIGGVAGSELCARQAAGFRLWCLEPVGWERLVMPTSTDIAFSPAVKAVQTRRGSRDAYARLEAKGGWATKIDANLAAFICEQRSFYLATASRDGQPYIQHRGGPPGVLRVLDETTLAFADFAGNRQYISTGNLAENPKAMIFLMDYANRRRVKIWGTARVVDNDPALIARLFPDGYKARAEAAIVFTVETWDVNCPQHIPQMFFADDVAALDDRIGALEADNARLSAALTKANHMLGEDL